jgi:3',5'-cyclic AMP phosphodiesterase CpdA
MKIVHISDIHIHDEPILGHDPVENFQKCLSHVAEFQSDADRIVITGDLTHYGRGESYERLRALITASTLKGKLLPRLMIGNHDSRETFRKVFSGAPTDLDGFVQWTEDTPIGLFVYMDTMEPGTHAGHYCARRQNWLCGILEKAKADGRNVYLFMHHNPLPVYVANADRIGIVQEAELQKILFRYNSIIRHIFFGHCHYTLSGVVAGIAYSATQSTNHTCWPDFSGDEKRMGYGDLTPSYNVCFLNESSSVVHTIDFLDEGKVKWQIEK